MSTISDQTGATSRSFGAEGCSDSGKIGAKVNMNTTYDKQSGSTDEMMSVSNKKDEMMSVFCTHIEIMSVFTAVDEMMPVLGQLIE